MKPFVGLARYYRRFVDDFSKIALLLTWLTRNEVRFEWDEGCEESFMKLKRLLTSSPVLTTPDGTGGLFVYSDASFKGIGCVVMQHDRVVAYALRHLKPYEVNYSKHDMELAAIVFALKIWRHYYYGEKFEIYTKHKSLRYIFSES